MTQTVTDHTAIAAGQQLTTLRLVRGSESGSHPVPVSFGIDLPRGLVSNGNRLGLRDADDQLIPIQTTPLAHWSDGSVKWLLLDAVYTHNESAQPQWSLSLNDADNESTRSSLDATTVTVRKRKLNLVRDGLTSRVRFELTRGLRIEPRILNVQQLAAGPIRRAEQIDGVFPGCRGLRFTCRISTFSGTGLVRMDVRLHNPNRAKHAGGLWDLGDAGSIFFDAFDVVIKPNGHGNSASWRAENDSALQTIRSGGVTIYQDSSGHENWRSPVHANCHGRNPCRFRGYRVEAPGRTESGNHAQPTVAIEGGDSHIAVAVPEFYQQFPNALEATNSHIRVGLFPLEWSDQFELQGGEQKTQTIWLDLGNGACDQRTLDWCHQPPRLSIPPEWHQETGAFPYFRSAIDDSDPRLTELIDGAVYGEDSLLERRNVIDQFGWRNFGEIHADHEQAYFDGQDAVISHYNNQFDSVYGGILQFARTGDPRWYELFDPLARHVVDIDIYHTNRDRSAYNGGLFWHTDHYADAGTCTHRTYTTKNAKPGQPYGGGPSDEHNYTTGLLYYYWLTGNPDARDAVLSLANWVINIDDGSQTVLGLVDSSPTGAASATADPDYHGPGRGAGNSVNALLDAWQLTQDVRYIEFAETLIRRVVHPDEDIDRLELLDAENRWSYTVFLSALARYLDLKHEAGQLDRDYEYGAACVANYGRWMAAHERPYLDHPDELEFPTETWAAQDLRKANVLRLAAKYCDETDRDRLLARGDDLADRAWEQLQQFKSRTVARSLAVMMSEGPRDAWLRSATFEPFQRNSTVSFEPRAEFVPQKELVRGQMRSPGGLIRMLARAAIPTRWVPFVRNLLRHF